MCMSDAEFVCPHICIFTMCVPKNLCACVYVYSSIRECVSSYLRVGGSGYCTLSIQNVCL